MLSLLIPSVQEWVSTNPVSSGSIFAAINTIIRFVTHGKISPFESSTISKGANLLMVCGLGLCMGSVVLLTSCGGMGGTAYRINTLPYQAKDRTIDDVVVVDAEDVEVIGGFSVNAGAKLLTDHGVVDISDKGINGEVVIDVRSGK